MAPSGSFRPVGKVVGTHGLKGGLKVRPLTDFVERFDPGSVVYLLGQARKIRACGWHKGQARIELEGISDVTTAEAVRGESLSVPIEDLPELDDGEYLASDLIGMAVETPDGRKIGTLDEVVASPAHDLFRIGDVLIPAIKEFVLDIDVKERKIVVDPVEGMLPGEEAVEVR
ncbi:MAG: 16S rRNA processing protein RimM [Armatimonadetes bacterium]|nr:16S rRNA processing protein RimM [Armatimonadota bacterium]